MDDLTKPIRPALRFACAIAMTIAAIMFCLAFVYQCVEAALVQAGGAARDPVAFAATLAIGGTLAFFTSYLSWRLWKGSVSSNGITIMPTWFIQTFGAFLLVGLLFSWWNNPRNPLLLEGTALALAMLLFHRHVAKRRQRDEENAE